MAYIGRPSIVGNFVKLDAITAVNGQAAYTMQNNSANFADYSTVNQFLVSLNGTIQSPGSSFTVSGSTLTFASNLSTGDVIDFIIVFGNSLSAGVPTDDTVSTAKIVDDAVTAAKINNDIISGSTELASEPADTDEFLVSDAGTIKRVDYSYIKGGGITEADQWRITSNFQGDANPLSANLERVDTGGWGKLGTGMSVSSGTWTFPSTGIWKIEFNVQAFYSGQEQYTTAKIRGTTDNSSYTDLANSDGGMENSSGVNIYHMSYTQTLFDCTDTSTHKIQFLINSEDNSNYIQGSSVTSRTYMMFTRLGDT